MELNGTIFLIGEIQQVSTSFKKRQLILKTNEQYSQEVPIDFVQDKCDILDKYAIGQNVKVGINIRGNSYNGKWYCSLNGWRIDKDDASTTTQAETFTAPSEVLQQAADDLPF